jgi:hypothetical protein
VIGIAEAVEDALAAGRRPEDGQPIRRHPLDPRPGAHDLQAAELRKQREHRAGALGEAVETRVGAVRGRRRDAAMAAADQHGPVPELLEGQRAARGAEHRREERRDALGDHEHRRMGFERKRLAQHRRDLAAPGAGGVDDRGRLEAPPAGLDPPCPALAPQRRDGRAALDAGAQRQDAAAKGVDRAVGDGGPVVAAVDRADAMRRQRRNEPAHLIGADQVFMVEPDGLDRSRPRAQPLQLRLGFGDIDLPAAREAAIVVDQRGDVMPERHRGGRQRHFGQVAPKAADPAGVDARGVTAGPVLLQHDHRAPAQRQMQRGRQPVQAGADHDHVGATRAHRPPPAQGWPTRPASPA